MANIENFLRKSENFKYLESLLRNKNYVQEEKKLDLKQEIQVIIQSKHSCLLDFSLELEN